MAYAESGFGQHSPAPNDWTGVSMSRSLKGCGNVMASFAVLASTFKLQSPYKEIVGALKAGTVDAEEFAAQLCGAYRPGNGEFYSRFTEFTIAYKEV